MSDNTKEYERIAWQKMGLMLKKKAEQLQNEEKLAEPGRRVKFVRPNPFKGT